MKTIWNYKDYLPKVPSECRVTIGEGQTPLVRSGYIGPSLGLKNLFFKLENLNPSGSYKDRFAAAFVSTLLEKKARSCISTSSGNTGAALAAYSAAAGIECSLVVVDGAPLAKIQQMQVYGGKPVMISGFGIDADITREVFMKLQKLSSDNNASLPISAYCYCPEGMTGVQTIAYEILDDLQGNVQHIFSPSGGGGLTLAIVKGLEAYREFSSACKVHCVQPEGNNTIAGALKEGLDTATEISSSTTLISGLQVPGVLDGTQTLLGCRKTGGTGFLVDDHKVIRAQVELAGKEGIFCEPAGAVSVSCLSEAVAQKQVDPEDTIVCLITGSGFKDMSTIPGNFRLPEIEILESINDYLNL